MLWFDERTHFYALHNNTEWSELLEHELFPAFSFQMHMEDNLDVMIHYSPIIDGMSLFICLDLKLFSIFRGCVLNSFVYRDLNMFMPCGAFIFWYRRFPNPPCKTVAAKVISAQIPFQTRIFTFICLLSCSLLIASILWQNAPTVPNLKYKTTRARDLLFKQ